MPPTWIVLLSYFVVGLHASTALTVQDVWYMQCKVKHAAMHGNIMCLSSFRISEWNVDLDSQPCQLLLQYLEHEHCTHLLTCGVPWPGLDTAAPDWLS